MQRLYNLDKWSRLEADHVANFGNTTPRRVRLDVNAPFPVRLYCHDTEGVTTFLALVHGRDVIEFAVAGEFGVGVEGGEVWLHTVDGEDFSFDIPEAETFTKLIERRARNPEVEMMNYMMKQNMQVMLDAQREDMARLLDRREAAWRAEAAKSEDTGDGKPDPAKPEPAKPAGDDVKPDTADGGDGAKAKK